MVPRDVDSVDYADNTLTIFFVEILCVGQFDRELFRRFARLPSFPNTLLSKDVGIPIMDQVGPASLRHMKHHLEPQST